MESTAETTIGSILTSCAQPSIVVSGPTWRVKLSVFDYTDSPIKQWRSRPIMYCVESLRAGAHRSTAFSTGHQLYYGPSLVYAVAVVYLRTRKRVGLPVTWRKYKALECTKNCDDFEGLVTRQIELW